MARRPFDPNANSLDRIRRSLQKMNKGAIVPTIPAGTFLAGGTSISTAAPITGGGFLSTTPTIGLSTAAIFSTVGGALDFAPENSTTVLAGPASGAAAQPTFRALTSTDLPSDIAYVDKNNTFTQPQIITTSPANNGCLAIHGNLTGSFFGVSYGINSVVTLSVSAATTVGVYSKVQNSGGTSQSIYGIQIDRMGNFASTILNVGLRIENQASTATTAYNLYSAGSTADNHFDGNVFVGGVLAFTTPLNTTAPLTGGGNLSTGLTLAITQAGSTTNGYLSSTDWNTFNSVATSPTYSWRNRVINGNFDFWQRGTSFSSGSGSQYTADRWRMQSFGSGGVVTVSQVSLSPATLGSTVPAMFALQWNQTTGGTISNPALEHRIENSLTLGGQTFTLSFWARVSSGTLSVTPLLRQTFNGSATVDTTLAAQTVTSTWQRFTVSSTLPSVSGKTTGTGDYLSLQFLFPTATTFTIQFAQVQVEPGSAASDFEFRPFHQELLLCQRYYERSYALSQANGTASALGPAIIPNSISALAGTTAGNVGNGSFLGFKIEKRVAPTIVLYAFDGTKNGCHVDNPGTGTTGERGGATTTNVNAAGALQFITFDNTGALAINRGACVFAHWTADAEL